MRIVLLNQYYAPDEAATAQLLADVGAGLARAGHQVVAVCSDRSYTDPSRRYATSETIDGVRVERVRTTGFGRGSRAGRMVDYATFLAGAGRRLLIGSGPQVVLSLSSPPMVGVLGVAAARVRGARSVYWVMDVYPDVAFELGVLRRGSLGGRVLGAMSRFALRNSHRVVALGETMAARLDRTGRRAVDVIHNWADETAIHPRPVEGHPLRERWGWVGRFVVLYSGNMGLAHEFDTVLEAAKRLEGEASVLFAFVGGGPRRAEVESEVKRRGLANVEFHPYVERADLGMSLTAGDLHLVTLRPRMPGLLVPSKIYGIMAAGRPTLYVGPSEGEIHDILAAGGCGALVEPGDVEGLVEAVRSYVRDEQRRRNEGQRSRSLFEERFTARDSVTRLVRLLEEAAKA